MNQIGIGNAQGLHLRQARSLAAGWRSRRPPVAMISPPLRIESMPSVTTIEGMLS